MRYASNHIGEPDAFQVYLSMNWYNDVSTILKASRPDFVENKVTYKYLVIFSESQVQESEIGLCFIIVTEQT